MFRAIGNAFWYVVMTPVRMCRWCINCIKAFQLFLDRRRNHICAGIIAIMMAVVGIQLRHAGYADLRPGEYVALSVGEAKANAEPETQQPASRSLREAIRESLRDFGSKIPSLRGEDEHTIEIKELDELTAPPAPESQPSLTVPPVTASRQRSIAPTAPSLQIPPATLNVKQISAEKHQTLVLPEPNVIDLSELDEPEVDVAALSGIIETDDEPSNAPGARPFGGQ